ncbi:cysteine-rich secretory protein 3-like [Thomomys bottae]
MTQHPEQQDPRSADPRVGVHAHAHARACGAAAAAELSPAQRARASADPGVASLSTALPEVQKEIVDKHNELRKAVSPSASNMLKMSWNAKAATNAQKWAEQCNYRHSDSDFRKTSTYRHKHLRVLSSLDLSCGENLFMSDYPTTWSSAIQTWYDENADFNFGVGPKTPEAIVGHYTQVVWYASYLVGCGVAHCPQQPYKFFMVCHYCPAGNFYQRRYTPYKEGKPCGLCPNDCESGLCTNACSYEDLYSNCKELKQLATCEEPMVKKSCCASCNCSDKIYNEPITVN